MSRKKPVKDKAVFVKIAVKGAFLDNSKSFTKSCLKVAKIPLSLLSRRILRLGFAKAKKGAKLALTILKPKTLAPNTLSAAISATSEAAFSAKSSSLISFKRIPESNKKIKTVMLMGFPMSCQRRVGEKGLFFLSKISTEYEILVFLKKIGLNVLYKAHPDRREEVEGVFDKVADRVIYDTFEKSWEMADAFIFTYTSTTTFAYALETDRKIILVDVDTNKTDKELRKKLGEIVDYVPATIANDSIRVKFDKEKLSEVLSP